MLEYSIGGNDEKSTNLFYHLACTHVYTEGNHNGFRNRMRIFLFILFRFPFSTNQTFHSSHGIDAGKIHGMKEEKKTRAMFAWRVKKKTEL